MPVRTFSQVSYDDIYISNIVFLYFTSPLAGPWRPTVFSPLTRPVLYGWRIGKNLEKSKLHVFELRPSGSLSLYVLQRIYRERGRGSTHRGRCRARSSVVLRSCRLCVARGDPEICTRHNSHDFFCWVGSCPILT